MDTRKRVLFCSLASHKTSIWTNCAGSKQSSCPPGGCRFLHLIRRRGAATEGRTADDHGGPHHHRHPRLIRTSPHPPGSKSASFQSYKYFMALCRQKTQGLHFMLHAKYLREQRVAGFVATDDGGRLAPAEGKLVVALEWGGAACAGVIAGDQTSTGVQMFSRGGKKPKLPPDVFDVRFSAVAMVTANQPTWKKSSDSGGEPSHIDPNQFCFKKRVTAMYRPFSQEEIFTAGSCLSWQRSLAPPPSSSRHPPLAASVPLCKLPSGLAGSRG